MYLLELHHENTPWFVGPFPTAERATEYFEASRKHGMADTHFIHELTVPYAVVKKVEWR